MENRKIPALIALAGIVIAVVVFLFVANDDTADQETETTAPAETEATAPADDPEGSDVGNEDEKPEKPAEPKVPELEIRGGAPVGGPLEVEVTEGDELRIDISTDAADELHLHSYDVYFDIVPGKTNELVVEKADIGGVFELESHTTGALLAEISVVPG
jgi:hypothetical protein